MWRELAIEQRLLHPSILFNVHVSNTMEIIVSMQLLTRVFVDWQVLQPIECFMNAIDKLFKSVSHQKQFHIQFHPKLLSTISYKSYWAGCYHFNCANIVIVTIIYFTIVTSVIFNKRFSFLEFFLRLKIWTLDGRVLENRILLFTAIFRVVSKSYTNHQ